MTDEMWTFGEIVRSPGAPKNMFAHLSVSAWRVGKSGKAHKDYRCREGVRVGNMRSAKIPLTQLTTREPCRCFKPVMDDLAYLREPATMIASLAVLAKKYRRRSRPLWFDRVRSLVEAATLRDRLRSAEQARTDLLAALAEDEPYPFTGGPASPEVLEAADKWATGTIAAAHAALAVVEANLGENPRRAAALVVMRPSLHDYIGSAYTKYRRALPALTDALASPASGAWNDALNDGLPRGEVLARVVATVDEAAATTDLEHVPLDVPVPAGLTLREAIATLWRDAARAQLSVVTNALLDEVDGLVAEESASLVMTWGDINWASEYGAFLEGAAHRQIGARVHVFLTETVVARAVETLTRAYVLPLPPNAPTRFADIDATYAEQFLTGPYVHTVVRFIEDGMKLDDAVAAATGIAAEPATMPA